MGFYRNRYLKSKIRQGAQNIKMQIKKSTKIVFVAKKLSPQKNDEIMIKRTYARSYPHYPQK